ncbi:MAG TPA: hypothetical protein VGN20_15595 [Mucilaginibacter sp.]|jgi:hypothetical protein
MKKLTLLFVHIVCASALLIVACSNPVKNKLKGSWHSKDGATKLNITEEAFALDDGESIPEQYFIKGDTIFTSYQGNQPYTSFVVQELDEHYLKLLGPDSVAVEFNR